MNDRLTRSIDAVSLAARRAIASRMACGALKYDADDWRSEPFRRHVLRAVRHAVTALEIQDGYRADDGDDHLGAAVCRLAMALGVRDGRSAE